MQVILSMKGVFLELHFGRIFGSNCLVGLANYISPCEACSLRRSIFNGMKNVISNVVTLSTIKVFEKRKVEQERISFQQRSHWLHHRYKQGFVTIKVTLFVFKYCLPQHPHLLRFNMSKNSRDTGAKQVQLLESNKDKSSDPKKTGFNIVTNVGTSYQQLLFLSLWKILED